MRPTMINGQVSAQTFEFFSYRGPADHARSGGTSPLSDIDFPPLTPASDPVVRLTRERSTLRLRLATVERTSRPTSPAKTSNSDNNPPLSARPQSYQYPSFAGTSAPPPSARTPPTGPLSLAALASLAGGSDYSTSTLSYARATSRPRPQVNITTSALNPSNNTSTNNNSNAGTPTTTNKRPEPVSRLQTEPRTPNTRTPTSRRNRHNRQNRHKLNQSQQQQQPRKPSRGGEEFLMNGSPGIFGKLSHPRPVEKVRLLENRLRELQEILRLRDREIDVLKRDRERLLAEREQDKRREREREGARQRERSLERARERERTQERERERERERQREKEREQEKQKDRERERARDPERSFSNGGFRRSRSQAPASTVSVPMSSYSVMSADSEHHAHLRSLDVFLTKTDGWSGAQVIQAVEDLNAEITHFAATATDSCIFERRASVLTAKFGRGSRPSFSEGRSSVVPSISAEEAVEITPWLGAELAGILSTRDHTQDPMLVQLALQASIATCCARSLSLFCVGFPSKLDGLLSRVFTHMQGAEPQPTSSRWRALTHRSIRTLYPGLEEYAVSELVTTMIRWSAAVFSVSGCTSSPVSSKDKDPIPVTLRAQLRRIADAVYKLARVSREEILSTSFEVMLIESGLPFEGSGMTNAFEEYQPHASSMSDSHSAVAAVHKGRVLCTTELGLKCVTKRGKGFGTGAEGDELFERRVLLQPKVVLDSTVDALDHE